MAMVTLIGCIAGAIIGLTQVYKGIVGAMDAYKQCKKEKETKTSA